MFSPPVSKHTPLPTSVRCGPVLPQFISNRRGARVEPATGVADRRQLLQAIDQHAVQPADLHWQQRVHHLVRLCCGVDAPELPWFHPEMLALESQIAEPKHHRRVHEELLTEWQRVFDACTDLPHKPSATTVQALHLALWFLMGAAYSAAQTPSGRLLRRSADPADLPWTRLPEHVDRRP